MARGAMFRLIQNHRTKKGQKTALNQWVTAFLGFWLETFVLIQCVTKIGVEKLINCLETHKNLCSLSPVIAIKSATA